LLEFSGNKVPLILKVQKRQDPGQKHTLPGQKHTLPGHGLSEETDKFQNCQVTISKSELAL
jgi:hypothetical protein